MLNIKQYVLVCSYILAPFQPPPIFATTLHNIRLKCGSCHLDRLEWIITACGPLLK